MDPRVPDPAAPTPESPGSAADWTTEESVSEPVAPHAGADHTSDGTPMNAAADSQDDATTPSDPPSSEVPQAGSALQPKAAAVLDAAPTPIAPVEPGAPTAWLASAEGLVASDRSAPGGTVEAVPGPADPEFAATRVHPRATPIPEEWIAQPTWAAVPRPDPVNTGPVVHIPVGFDDQGYGDESAYGDARAVAEPKRRRRGVPWGALLMSFVLGVVLSGVAASGAIYAYEQQYADRILPNVTVGDVNVAGLGREAARSRLAEAYSGFGEGTVEVTVGDATTLIPYAQFNRRADLDSMLDAAFAVGREPALTDRLVAEFRAVTKGVRVEPTVILDEDALRVRIAEIARAAEWPAADAAAVTTPTGFATTPSTTGQVVDEGTAAAEIAAQLAPVDAPDAVSVALTATPIPPAVTDASARVASSQAALMANDVTLVDGEDSWVIPAATIHGWLSFTVINNRARIVIDTKAVFAWLKPLAEQIDREAVNATVKLSGTEIVFDSPSVEGRTFNASKTTTAVVNGLRNRALGNLAVDAPVPPVLALTRPALTTDDAKAAIPLMTEISSWTTEYQPSDRNGNGVNIRIPTTTINGYVVAPGETFSFWKAVGPVTRDLGYTDGGAIIDGRTEPQGALAGGICTCSTTLFNAALRAGLKMGDRLNHFYYINRYPLGLDATVFISASGQAQDMTWTNDTTYPVIIQGINGKAFVKFVLYGVPSGRTTTFSEPIVKNYTKATTETKVDKTLPAGTRKQIEYATDGQDVWVTRTVKDQSGVVIHENTYYSHYATITGIILTNP